MFQYAVVKETLQHCEIGPYTGYGIRAMKVSSSGSEEVAFVSDVSCEQAFVEQLAALSPSCSCTPVICMTSCSTPSPDRPVSPFPWQVLPGSFYFLHGGTAANRGKISVPRG